MLRFYSVTQSNFFFQSSFWILDHQQFLLQPKTVMQKDMMMAKHPNCGSVSVMVLDPFHLQSPLVISLQCCCCCWIPYRLAAMLIIKEIMYNNPLYDVTVVFRLPFIDSSEGLFYLWPGFHLWRDKCSERVGSDCAHRKWGLLPTTFVCVFFLETLQNLGCL